MMFKEYLNSVKIKKSFLYLRKGHVLQNIMRFLLEWISESL